MTFAATLLPSHRSLESRGRSELPCRFPDDARGTFEEGCRVDPGGRPPKPPTDPDVQISRIRFFEDHSLLPMCSPPILYDARLGKRIPRKHR